MTYFKQIAFFTLCFSFSILSFSQDMSLYKKRLLITGTDTLPYRILLPKNYDANTRYPLLIFLHGAGERGNNNEAQLTHCAKAFLVDSIRDQYPAIIVFPQCPAASYWSNVSITTDTLSKQRVFNFLESGKPSIAMQMVMTLIGQLQNDYKINKKQVYAAGLSMGGMGTLELVRRKPKLFAAAIAICGGANTATAPQIAKTKWWLFHGEQDNVVPPALSKQMAAALQSAGADVRLTLYPNANHNSWDSAFAEKALLPWLFTARK